MIAMLRKPALFLPLLLSLPLALSAQSTKQKLSPTLKAKLLAQNTVPGATPAGAPPVNPAEAAPATAVPETPTIPAPDAIPAGTPASGTTPAGTPAIPSGAPATPAPGTTPTPEAAPRPTVPRPSIPLPGARTPGNRGPGSRTATPANSGAPGTVPPPPAAPATEPDPNNPYGDIAFLDAPIGEVITKYEEITRRHVIRDLGLQGTVTVYANPNPVKPFTAEEAADFIKAALAIQGFVIQPYRNNIDKILSLTKPPGIEGAVGGFPLYTREEDLPEEDVVVNFVLTLTHLPAVDAVSVIAAAVPVRQWAKYIPVASANAIFIQEFTSNIRTLLKVVKSLDLPPIEMIHEWVELERASAEDVQAILDQILQAQTKGAGSSAGGSGFRSISPAAAAANLVQPGGVPQPVITTGSSGGASSGLMPDGSQVIVKADPRTNRVFVRGTAKDVKTLKMLIREFDEPSTVKNLLTQQLRYIPVADFFGLAVTSLEATGAGQAGSGSAGGGGASGTGGARNTGGTSGTGGTGGGGGDFRSGFNSRNSASTSQFGGGGFGGGGTTGGRSSRSGGGGGGGLSGGTAGTLGAPQAQTVGKTLLISDPRTNSLIVSGPPDSIQRVSDLVREMDRRPYQVHINAVIAQMAIGDDMQSSVDILKKTSTINVGGENISTSGFFRSGASGSFIDPAALNSPITVPALSGLNFYAAAEELFNAYVRLLETSNKSKLLAKPHITVANNEVGTISSGTRVPIPANQQTSIVGGGSTSVNSSVEYENVVLSLDVLPLINSRNEITLTVNQLNDSIEGTTNISGNEIPNISTQELSTKITIPNGAILILGGLIREDESKTNSGIPVLSKIPVLKYLIGTNSRRKQRRELVVLLQARIIENADDIIDVNASEIQRTVVGPDAELFAKPDRNTENVKLPTFENDVRVYESSTTTVRQK